MNQISKIFIIFFMLLSQHILTVMAEDAVKESAEQEFSQDAIVDFIKDYLKEKAKYTGKVDLYDERINKVRNLDLIDIETNGTRENDQYVTRAKFRDFGSGDIATVKIMVGIKGGKFETPSLTIENVDKIVAANVLDPNHQHTDQEVKDAIVKYLKQKSEFTGTFDMFDEKTQKMRKLETGNVQENVRKFGSRFIGRVDAVERAVDEKLELDVSVDNKEGILEVKSVKIYSVNNVQR